MEPMLRICEQYAAEYYLEFSTDPNPDKSKSKCIFMCCHLKKAQPANPQLYGLDLPWVKTATHLRHELSSECNMEEDMRCKRGACISKSTEVRESFDFAQPSQILQAVRTYFFDMYGAMTWSLYSDKAKQVFNTWSTCVKLAWGGPRGTHTYLVDNLLCSGIPSIRSSVLARYCKFVNSARTSPSLEVRVVANISAADVRSPTGRNLRNMEKEAGMSLTEENMWKMRRVLLELRSPVPSQDRWRLGCLRKFLTEKYRLLAQDQDTEAVELLIDSLCES